MSTYRIVCTDQIPFQNHPTRAKIVSVGTGSDASKAETKWTVAEVIAAIDQGHSFYTKGPQSGKIAYVEKYWCASCSEWHIRSKADAVVDNNLDSLRRCRSN